MFEPLSSEYELNKTPITANKHSNTLTNKKKKRTRKKISWSEKEEKTLFILQMALGSKFSIIKTFVKDKSINDLKNHFYSKLRTYLSIQLSKLQQENFFQNIDIKKYTIGKILTLVISSKTPTMILNRNVIKELILENEKKNLEKKDKNSLKENKTVKKRGRPRKTDTDIKKKEKVNFNINNSVGKGKKNFMIELEEK